MSAIWTLDVHKECMPIIQSILPSHWNWTSTSLVSLQHCYTSDWDECSEWLTRYPGLMVGFTPFICNSRFERPIHEVVRKIPLDRILFETDSPYFLPPKLKISEDGSFIEDLPPSHPGHVIHTAAQVRHKWYSRHSVIGPLVTGNGTWIAEKKFGNWLV